MASPFDVFNRDIELRRVTNSSGGSYNQTTGVWTASTKTPSVILGHISTVDRFNRETEWRQGPAGPTEDGEMRLFSETLLEKGEVVEADQGGGVVFRYRVLAMVQAQRLMARKLGTPVRYHYRIVEVPR